MASKIPTRKPIGLRSRGRLEARGVLPWGTLGLLRSQVAAYLDWPKGTVEKHEGKELHPWQDDKGVWRFDPEEVAELCREIKHHPEKKSGTQAAELFRRFSEGMTLQEIVMEMEIDPDVVRKYRRDWRRGYSLKDRPDEAPGVLDEMPEAPGWDKGNNE